MMASNTTSSCVCQYCNNTYQDPRILSCLHSYCVQCITKLHVDDTTSIICPTCNHSTSLPDGSVTSLPRNIRLSQETKQDTVLSKVTSTSPPPCDSCDETSPIAYCTECDKLLCNVCWEAHQKLKFLRSHSSFTLKEAQNMSRDKLIKMLPSSYFSSSFLSCTCQYHNNETLDLYCQQCTIPLCVEFSDIYHKDHSVHHVSQQISQNKEEIQQSLEEFQLAQHSLKNVMIAGEEMKEKIKARKIEVDDTIRQAFVKLQQLLHQRKEVLLAKNSEEAMAKNVRLSIQLEGIQHLLDSLGHCHSLASIATSEYSDVELLSIAHTLHKRANDLQKLYSETSLDLCESPNISVDVNTDTLATMITEFGCISDSNSTAVIPHNRLTVGAEMKVKVVSRDSRGQEVDHGGEMVSCSLTSIGNISKECQVTDNSDGTYLVSVTPQQSGQHKLSIVIGQDIQGSPFDLIVVPQRDYTKIKDPVQTITGINSPRYIAFSDKGDVFVTSYCDNCIHVYDSNGKKKTSIGSKVSGELQFEDPRGITIIGEIVYVAECGGHRIHKLTTRGEFLGTFGQEGSGVGQFNGPCDIKISSEGMVYVADRDNSRIQVFHSDWTVSHIIDGKVLGDSSFTHPEGISLDLSGNVHVTGDGSDSVTVFSASGQFVYKYDQTHLESPTGIAIDSAGYSLVVNYSSNSLAIFDPGGTFIYSIGGFRNPFGVSVSPDGSIWVADHDNNRLVKF